MDSIGSNCNELKKQYDACFNSWFSEKFLKGETDDSKCAPMFKIYQHCVKVRAKSKDVISVLLTFDQLQEALKEHNLDFKELENDHLGSEKEYKKPAPGKTGSNKSTNAS
jgi:TRIAP1/MDM35 family protein